MAQFLAGQEGSEAAFRVSDPSAWSDGPGRLPADPGRRARGGGCVPGDVPGPGEEGEDAPGSRLAHELALRGRPAGRQQGAGPRGASAASSNDRRPSRRRSRQARSIRPSCGRSSTRRSVGCRSGIGCPWCSAMSRACGTTRSRERLGCPVGTVESRLSRARGAIADPARPARAGTDGLGAGGGLAAAEVRVPPPSLVEPTVQAAMEFSADPGRDREGADRGVIASHRTSRGRALSGPGAVATVLVIATNVVAITLSVFPAEGEMPHPVPRPPSRSSVRPSRRLPTIAQEDAVSSDTVGFRHRQADLRHHHRRPARRLAEGSQAVSDPASGHRGAGLRPEAQGPDRQSGRLLQGRIRPRRPD